MHSRVPSHVQRAWRAYDPHRRGFISRDTLPNLMADLGVPITRESVCEWLLGVQDESGLVRIGGFSEFYLTKVACVPSLTHAIQWYST